jgi:hypothetical protein
VIGRLIVLAIFSTVPLNVSFAQKLADPDKVAPEYRAAAEKRRAEQIKVADCSHKADEAKVLIRDRTAHIQHCLDEQLEARSSVLIKTSTKRLKHHPAAFGIP